MTTISEYRPLKWVRCTIEKAVAMPALSIEFPCIFCLTLVLSFPVRLFLAMESALSSFIDSKQQELVDYWTMYFLVVLV